MKRRFTRAQRQTIVLAGLSLVVTIVVLQLWLLTATMDAFLRGDDEVLFPALAASAVCLALNLGLFVQLRRLDG